jgi:competence protein ComEA
VAFFPLTVPQRRIAAALLVCLVAGLLMLRHQGSGAAGASALRVAPVRPAPASPAPAASGGVVVDVVGAVARPGLYHLPRGSRVADAVARAGGLTRRAERTAVNLAAPVSDGQQVLVAARGSPAAGAGAAGSGAAAGPVSLSSASVELLDTLPGVGPVTAQKIVDYRQAHGAFRSLEELDAVPGIGAGRIAQLKGLVVP